MMQQRAAKRDGGHLQALEALHQKTSGNLRKNMETALVVSLWFIFNISLANFTKWLYLYGEICLEGPEEKCVFYKFPLAITVVHMLFSWVVCYIQIYYVRKSV